MGFLSVGIDIGLNQVRLIAADANEQTLIDAKKDKNPGEAYRVFPITSQLAQAIFDWFLAIGVERADAVRNVVQIGHAINALDESFQEAEKSRLLNDEHRSSSEAEDGMRVVAAD